VQKQQTKKINERLQNVAAATSCGASSYTGSSCRTQKLQLPNNTAKSSSVQQDGAK